MNDSDTRTEDSARKDAKAQREEPASSAFASSRLCVTSHFGARASVESDYREAWQNHFSREHDPSALRCESNVFRYRPCRGVVLRLDARDEKAIERAQLAAEISGAPLIISIRDEESDAQFIARLPELAKRAEFLRTVAAPGDEVLRAAHDAGLNWIDAPLLANGRVELTRWLREQSVTETRHRYGQLAAARAAYGVR
jgi:RHH-type proline utilization regulon transcriptional repressor/proline dehydrogenase/delta 1-pyrroline-5-carboxylate dehydrogenase